MNVLVLDESLDLAGVVGQLAPLRGWQPHFIGSLHELELGFRAYGRPALVIVNLQAPLTAWQLGQRLMPPTRQPASSCSIRLTPTKTQPFRARRLLLSQLPIRPTIRASQPQMLIRQSRRNSFLQPA